MMFRPLRLPARRTLALLGLLYGIAALGGIAFAVVLSRDIPGIEQLSALELPQSTILLDRHGERFSSFAEQRRTSVPLSRMSPWLIKGLLATEDPRFYDHVGIDPQAIARALVNSALSLDWGAEGGSTITQQLARGIWLHPQKTVGRKLREAVLAALMEKQYSKDEILELYANRIYLGHGNYGFEAAARFFFDKGATEVSLAEAALLAGLPQRPEALSPVKNPERALRRRNHVLDRMVREGYLDARLAAAAKKAPLGLVKPSPRTAEATYFVEEVRRRVARQFGDAALYRDGLVVETTLDPAFQAAAERAVAAGLESYAKRWKRPAARVPLADATDPLAIDEPAWQRPPRAGDILPAIVLSSDAQSALLRVGDQRLTFGMKEVEWTGITRLERALPPHTQTRIRVLEATPSGQITKARLAGESEAEAALVALDPATGEVLALVGGKNFDRSEFNRAVQAKRQAGSAFKPFIFAAGLENGFMPNQLVLDEPVVLSDPGSPGAYAPQNYDRKFDGLVTLRYGLEHSRNVPTVKLLNALGYQPAVELARRLGIATDLKPYPSLALGSFEVTLLDLVAAYGAFDNGGILVTPQADPAGREPRRHDRLGRAARDDRGPLPRGRGDDGLDVARRDRARHRARRPVAGVSGRRKDRDDRRLLRRLVHRLHTAPRPGGLGRVRPAQVARARRDRGVGRAPDLDRVPQGGPGGRTGRAFPGSGRPRRGAAQRPHGPVARPLARLRSDRDRTAAARAGAGPRVPAERPRARRAPAPAPALPAARGRLARPDARGRGAAGRALARSLLGLARGPRPDLDHRAPSRHGGERGVGPDAGRVLDPAGLECRRVGPLRDAAAGGAGGRATRPRKRGDRARERALHPRQPDRTGAAAGRGVGAALRRRRVPLNPR